MLFLLKVLNITATNIDLMSQNSIERSDYINKFALNIIKVLTGNRPFSFLLSYNNSLCADS